VLCLRHATQSAAYAMPEADEPMLPAVRAAMAAAAAGGDDAATAVAALAEGGSMAFDSARAAAAREDMRGHGK
jgi:hypothetical protein